MGKHVAEATVATAAPPHLVWAILADARSWDSWGPWTSAELEREGAPEPDGVGAIRVFTKKPIVSREEVVVFEPPSRLEYRLLSGLPVRDYHAVVRVTPSGPAARSTGARSSTPRCRGCARSWGA